ncbi:MAG: hypothetical protein KDA32_09615 [Phycisphaerales bacterium]|nr:hypothetical protein [Phycisphaerales bacterium]
MTPRRCTTLVACLSFSAIAAAQSDDGLQKARMARVIERIVTGSDAESKAATEKLIREAIDPVVAAIGSTADRPIEEQLRLRAAIGRMHAALRIGLYRANLPPEDAALFDDFCRVYPDLTYELFDISFQVRMAALRRVPLEARTGAGLMMAARVDDEDEDVASEAVALALKLADPVVARALSRYLKDVIDTMKAGVYGPGDQDIAMTLALLAHQCVRVIGKSREKEHTPLLLEAISYFVGAGLWNAMPLDEALGAVGQLRDPRAAQLLANYAFSNRFVRMRRLSEEASATQTLGDVAMYGVILALDGDPAVFGFEPTTLADGFPAFPNDSAREAARLKFRQWLAEKGISPGDNPVPEPTAPGGARERRIVNPDNPANDQP